MNNNNDGRVLHFGEYDGREIEEVVDLDPAYIIWAEANVQGSGIGRDAVERARRLLDTYDDGMTVEDNEIQELIFGAGGRYEWD